MSKFAETYRRGICWSAWKAQQTRGNTEEWADDEQAFPLLLHQIDYLNTSFFTLIL